MNVEIDKKRLDSLYQAEKTLNALNAAGVDNWDGYSIAMEMLEEDEEGIETECSTSPEEIEESGIECEFEDRDGSKFCTTHNCWA